MSVVSLRILAVSLLPTACFDPAADVTAGDATDDSSETAATLDSGSGTDGSVGGTTEGGSESGQPACAPGHACMPAAPNGWTGPTFVYQTTTGELPECPAAAATVSIELNASLAADPAICGCECGEPLDPECANATLTSHNTTTCDDPTTMTGLTPSTCTPLPPGQSHSLNSELEPTVFSGSCEASATVEVPEASWEEAVRACIGSVLPDERCALDEVCIEQPPSGRACIHRTGDHSCPLQGYTERFQAFVDLEDDRGCDECTCGEIVDGLCTRTVAFYTADDCIGAADDVLAEGDFCSQVQGTVAARLETEISGECSPNPPRPIGQAVGTGAETFCCWP